MTTKRKTELPFISSDVNNEYIGSVRGTGRQGDGYPTLLDGITSYEC